MAGELYVSPVINLPTLDQLRTISKDLGFHLTDEDLLQHQEYMKGAQKAYQRVSELVEPTLEVKYPRTPGYRPDKQDNLNNAWAWRTDIQGAKEGKLYGKTIAIKDSIAVAGVPMSNGSKIFQGYVPEFDATVVTRVLDAGGRITGKAQCENLTWSGTSSTGPLPVTNPIDETRSTGGSSSGSGALVASGQVDLSIGGDQGGSIRIPASWCGIVGLKPTFGLVPYSGACSLLTTLDHLGPMSKTVDDCALLLEVIAGNDGFDFSRQGPERQVPEYTKLLDPDISGLKVGFVEEGFENCEADVQEIVRATSDVFLKAGATVEDVSIPMHRDAGAIWVPIGLEGTYLQASYGGSMGKGFYPNSLTDHFRNSSKSRPYDLPLTWQQTCLWAEYSRRYYGQFFGKCQNLAKGLTDVYNKALETYDVLVMPTLPFKAPKLPREDSTAIELLKNGSGMIQNTAATDLTGHPSISLNAGFSEGLPVGVMITGRHYEDATVLKAAKALESGLKMT